MKKSQYGFDNIHPILGTNIKNKLCPSQHPIDTDTVYLNLY